MKLKSLSMAPQIPKVLQEGQEALDEPVYAWPKSRSEMEWAVMAAFGQVQKPSPVLLGYERVKLRWLKRDASGKLVPKE